MCTFFVFRDVGAEVILNLVIRFKNEQLWGERGFYPRFFFGRAGIRFLGKALLREKKTLFSKMNEFGGEGVKLTCTGL